MNIMLDMHMHGMHFRSMKLSQYLEKNELTDAAFAAKVGMSQSQVSRLRRGVSRPSWDAVAAIERETAKAVSAADFLPTSQDDRVGAV